MPVNLIKRNGVWHINDTLGPPGRRVHVRQSTKTTDKAKAQRLATEVEGKIWRGSFDGPSAILTFEEACKIYLAGGKSDRLRFLQPIREYLGSTLVKDIKPSTLKQMAIELFPNNSGASKNRRALTPAAAVINNAAAEELCSPIIFKERFKEFTKVKTPATLEWVRGFQTTATEILGAYALFMFLTGCRPSEGLAIDRERDLDLVDLNHASAIINNGKVGHERRAHLPRMLAIVLANLPWEKGRPLFWYDKLRNVYYPWDQACKRAGIKRLTPHCCRHGCVTQLLYRGVDVVTVGWLVDMTPQMVLETYGHALKDATLTDRLIDTDLTRALSEVVENKRMTGTSGN